jgi:hypothetical protein
MQTKHDPTPFVKPPVPSLKLPLPNNWHELRARELFNLSRPLTDKAYDLGEVPEWRAMAEQAERYRKRYPIPEIVLRNAQLAIEKGPASWHDLPISMVSSATETKTYSGTVGEVLAGIREGKWENRSSAPATVT